MEEVGCVLCARSATRPYKRENGYDSVQCARCGLVFVSPRPTIQEMKALYQGQETKIDLAEHVGRREHKTSEARRLLRMMRRYRAGGRLLEIGSAAGYFLAEARQQGYEVQGLDITEQFVRFSNDVLRVPVIEGTLHDAALEGGGYDIVFMRNVLSHLAHPLAEHRIIHGLLRPGGLLFFETGNVAELPPERAGELELPDHLYHFSEATIRMLLEETGFRWLATDRFTLLSRLPVMEWLGARLARPPSPRRPDARPLVFALPKARPLSRAHAAFDAFVRYDVGRLLPSRGRRCTLVVAAAREG